MKEKKDFKKSNKDKKEIYSKKNNSKKTKTNNKKRRKSSLNLDNIKEITIEEKGTKKEKAIKAKEKEKHIQKVRKVNNSKKHDEIMLNLINKRKKRNLLILSSLLIFILLIIFSTIFALINLNNEKIFKNIYVGNISVSGMSQEEAINTLITTFKETSDKPITLKLRRLYKRNYSK